MACTPPTPGGESASTPSPHVEKQTVVIADPGRPLAAPPAIAALAPVWDAVQPLGTARHSHSTTLLPSGKVLVAGGSNGAQAVATAELYDPTTGLWTPTGAMPGAHFVHCATLLPSGQVLVTGGEDGTKPIGTAELYDLASGTWRSARPMSTARSGHTATVLKDGRVLVVGGSSGTTSLASAELYDPSTNVWTATRSLVNPRSGHTATLLPSGKVLVGGGAGVTNAELYDPASGTWSPAGTMTTLRNYPAATVLVSGRVLVAGGQSSNGMVASAELYDPATNSWSATGSMSMARMYPSATALPSGKLLVAGGLIGVAPIPVVAAAELYDPATGTWSAAPSLSVGRYWHTATLLPSGRVLVVGGFDTNTALATNELYDAESPHWGSTGTVASARNSHVATLLSTGKVLIAGGVAAQDGHVLATTELYDPEPGTWAGATPMSVARMNHTLTPLPSGRVLAVGGFDGTRVLASSELFDPQASVWVPVGDMTLRRGHHTATLLPSGKVLVTGGQNEDGFTNTAELYDLATGTWSPTGVMPNIRARHVAVLLSTGKVLVAGGTDGTATLGRADLYDPVTGKWSVTGDMSVARQDPTVTVLPSGRVLVAGGSDGTAFLTKAEVYDPVTGTWTATTNTMTAGRRGATATLLPSGRVLLAGGSKTTQPLTAELYEPATGLWTSIPPAGGVYVNHSATLLPRGKVLLTGGLTANVELLDDRGALEEWRPEVTSPDLLPPGTTVVLAGKLLRGLSEASSGGFNSSPSGIPLFALTSLESGARVTLTVDRFTDTSATVQVPRIAPGAYVLSVLVNGVSSSREVRVADDTLPETRFTTAPAAITNVRAGPFTLDSPDSDLMGFECSLDSAAFAPCGRTPTLPALADGSHTLAARAIDTSGNMDATPERRTWTLDTQPPAPPVVTSPAEGDEVTGLATITGTAEVGSQVSVYFDGELAGTATATDGKWSVESGLDVDSRTHALTATATDVAGNVSQGSPALKIQTRPDSYYAGCGSAGGAPSPWAWVSALFLLSARWLRGASRGAAVVLALCVFTVPSRAVAEPASCPTCPRPHNPSLRRVERLYGDLEYEKALSLLQKVRAQPGNGPEDVLWMDLMEGMLQYGLGRMEPSDAAFGRALAQDATVSLPVEDASSTLRERFTRLRQQRMQARAPAPPVTPPPAPAAPPPTPEASPSLPPSPEGGWALRMVGLRGERDMVGSGMLPAVTAEVVHAPHEAPDGFGYGAALTVLGQKAGPDVRAEGRLFLPGIQGSGGLLLRPYGLLGATAFIPQGAVGGRAGLGLGLRTGRFHVFADVAYERFVNTERGFGADALLLAVGAGWAPMATSW
ncbi:Kelch repeat-containing protein [Citreicoccus inhibens]|uniref:Kelch repeat-containing protein n=1 Tax=Citreicoccus inhibens TaxID=2849499 RepID=UPI0022A6CF7C|nr:kelch repeat-containing protein [Citreicoccus inhibens]